LALQLQAAFQEIESNRQIKMLIVDGVPIHKSNYTQKTLLLEKINNFDKERDLLIL
jgi:hypothetical protein